MPVARDDLGRDRLDLQPQLVGDVLFDIGIDVGEGADGAGNGAGGDLRPCRHQPLAVAGEGGVVARQLEAEGRRLGMDAVAAADGRRVLVLDRAALQGGQQRVEIGQQQVGRLGHLDGQRRVEHVRRGHALVDEAGVRTDIFGQVGQEGDDVVLGLALDLIDPVDVELALLPDGLGGGARDHSQFGLGIAGMGLDLEPDAELVFRFPDTGHFRAAIARNHRSSLNAAGWRGNRRIAATIAGGQPESP